MTALDPRPDTTPTPADGGPDGEVGAWRRLVTNYREAWTAYDELPGGAAPLRLLKARAKVAGTRYALFAHLDDRLRTPDGAPDAREETTTP